MVGHQLRAHVLLRLVSAVILVALALVMLAQASALGAACPAGSGQGGCSISARAGWIRTGSAVTCVLFLVLVVTSALTLWARSLPVDVLQMVFRAAGVLLGCAAVVFPLATAYSGSFAIDGNVLPWVALEFLVCVALTAVVVSRGKVRAAGTDTDRGASTGA